MEAYRDQYATLFNAGRGVTLIAISADPDSTLASWARASDFPQLFASDSGGSAGKAYGSWMEKPRMNSRFVFVVDTAGRIVYRATPFNALSSQAYAELAAAVDRTAVPAQGEEGH